MSSIALVMIVALSALLAAGIAARWVRVEELRCLRCGETREWHCECGRCLTRQAPTWAPPDLSVTSAHGTAQGSGPWPADHERSARRIDDMPRDGARLLSWVKR